MITRRSILLGGTAFGAQWALGTSSSPPAADESNALLDAAMRLGRGQAKKLSILLPEGCRGSIEAVGASFERSTGVGLEFREVPVDRVNTHLMISGLSKNTRYHLALPATFGIPDLAESGCILPLDAFAEEHEPKSFRDGNLYSIGDFYKGKLYGYQTDGDAYGLFYNKRFWAAEETKRRFESECGFSPGPAKTWQQLDRMMEFFSDPEAGQHGGTLFRTPDYIAWEWWMRFHSKGLYPVDEEMRPQFDGPEGLAALEELILASRHQAPGSRTNGLFKNWEAFAAGNACCNIGWGGTQKFLIKPDSRVRDDLAFGLAPGGSRDESDDGPTVSMPYFNWGWNYTVPESCPDPELAYLFALYATTTEPSIAAIGSRDSFFDPFREEHYEDPGVIEAYGEEYLDVHRRSMKESIPDFYLAGQSEYLGLLRSFISRAEQGRIEPAEALSAIAGGWEKITERKGRDGQIEQWEDLRSRYPAAARDFLR